jgi:hypothetical protein
LYFPTERDADDYRCMQDIELVFNDDGSCVPTATIEVEHFDTALNEALRLIAGIPDGNEATILVYQVAGKYNIDKALLVDYITEYGPDPMPSKAEEVSETGKMVYLVLQTQILEGMLDVPVSVFDNEEDAAAEWKALNTQYATKGLTFDEDTYDVSADDGNEVILNVTEDLHFYRVKPMRLNEPCNQTDGTELEG